MYIFIYFKSTVANAFTGETESTEPIFIEVINMTGEIVHQQHFFQKSKRNKFFKKKNLLPKGQ